MTKDFSFSGSTMMCRDTIGIAVAKINDSLAKLVVVLDENGSLHRTITDGDVRRALLDGAHLDDPVSILPDQTPITFPEGTDHVVLLEAMDHHGINAIVLIDKEGRPVDLADRKSLHQPILLSPPHMSGSEASLVQRAFTDNWIAPAGPNLDAFEADLADLSTREHAVALSSGTAGLHLAIRALNLPPKTRLYVSDLTFAGTIQPLLYEGLTPVLIDSDPKTWNMSVGALQRKIEDDEANGLKGGAVMVVHLYGQSADVAGILAVTEAHNLPLIEDAAESLGADYENRPSGAHGLIGVYSFNGNKIITTSGGGALVTDNSKIAARVRKLATQGREPVDHYQHSTVAYNYRMSNIVAGVGLGQIAVLPERVAARRAIFERYREGLDDILGLSFQQDSVGSKGNRWLTSIEFDPDYIKIHPYQIMRQLRQLGIETRPGWKPMHMQPICHKFDFVPHSDTQAVSGEHFMKALCFPSGSNLTEVEQTWVIESLRTLLMESSV